MDASLPPLTLTLHVDRAPFVQAGLQHVVARVELPPAWGEVPRPRLRLVVALDRSSSMAGEPLARAKAAVLALLNELGPDDEIALVAFDARVALHAPPRRCRPGHLIGLTEALDALEPGSGTALFDGWRTAVRVACAPADDGAPRQRHVVVLSDGHPYGGLDDPDAYGEAAALALGAGVATTSIGIGSHYEETLLAALARRGSGRFYDAERVDHVLEVVRGELDELRRVVVEDAVLTLPRVEGVALRGVSGFPTRDDVSALRVELGALAAGERRRAVIAVDARGAADRMLRFTARVDAQATGRAGGPSPRLASHAAVSVPLGGAARPPVVDLEAAATVVRHRRNRALEAAGDAKLGGDLLAARRILERELVLLGAMPPAVPDRAEAIRLLGEVLEALGHDWIRRSAKTITSAVQADLYGTRDRRRGVPPLAALGRTLVSPDVTGR